MKRYHICFFILAALLAAALLTGTYFYLYRPEKGEPIPNGIVESESAPQDGMVISQRLVQEIVDGQGPGGEANGLSGQGEGLSFAGPASEDRSLPEGAGENTGLSGEEAAGGALYGEVPDGELRYCLVSENGFLLVFAKDKGDVCLDTHMPLTEFPETEQERLEDGIWFSTMIEVLNYLESYSS